MTTENSGLDCGYYTALVYMGETIPEQSVECGDLVEALDMTPNEANIFKEIWRSANFRLGKKKKWHNQLRGAEKILWHAKRNYKLKKRGMK